MLRRRQQLHSMWRLLQPRSGGITQNIEELFVWFQEKLLYYNVCIARAVVHEHVRTAHNWACVGCKSSSFYICRGVDGWISLESTWIYNNCLFFVNNKVLYFHVLQPMHLPFGLPLTSLLSFLLFLEKKQLQQKTNKQKNNRNKSQKKHTKTRGLVEGGLA